MRHLLIMFISLLSLFSCSKKDGILETEPTVESGINFQIMVGSRTFTGTFYATAAAEVFRAILPFTITMSDMNDNEKHCDLSQSIPTSAVRPGTIRNGDLMLYGSRTLVLFYKTFSSSYSYTRIGRVDNPSGLEATLGRGNISVRFEQISQATQYTLTYNTNGANGTAPLVVTADQGSRIALNNGDGLSRNGYSFVGWNTNENGTGTNYPAGSSYTINSNVTLYAKWETVTNNNNNNMKITVGNTIFTATLATNATATAFKTLLPITLNMSDFNNNEKVCSLPNSLTTSASNHRTIHTGDIMLYGPSSLVLFYETFSTSYSYTRIGQVDNISGFKAALGSGSVSVKFELIN